MPKKFRYDVVHRWEGNPLITLDDIPFPCITKIGDIYYIMYTAVSPYGPLLALAQTEDFKTFERIALVSEPENKDGVLFPEKINGKYARLDHHLPWRKGRLQRTHIPAWRRCARRRRPGKGPLPHRHPHPFAARILRTRRRW